jgi:primosomal protein N' (replication factor Y)
LGQIVEIPLRNKKVYGLVTDCISALEKKSEIKNLAYNLRKIDKIKSKSFFLPDFMEAVKSIADFYATTTGSILNLFTHKDILDSDFDLKNTGEIEKGISEIFAIQADEEDRYSTYKSYIREEFAKKKSVFFCLSSTEDIKSAKEILEKGIENYTYILHSGLDKKTLLLNWQNALRNPHPVLIIATGFFISIPREDISSIILDKENSRGFNTLKRPFLDIRKVMEIISKKLSKKLIFGDMLLRVETIYKVKNDEYFQMSNFKFRQTSTAKTFIVDTRTPKNQEKKSFEIISKQLEELVKETKISNSNIFLYCVRKGSSPITVCGDCGQIVKCNNCDSPVVLYEKKNDKDNNYFLCHRCMDRRSASELCSKCNSWKLTLLGIGIDSAVKEIKNKFPELKVFVMDKNTVTTHKKALSIINEFYNSPGSLLVGTEMALSYLDKKIANTGVISLDSLFAIPDFKINEKIAGIILKLRAISTEVLLIQTREPENKVIDYASKGNILDFYKDEINDREEVGYPPFSVFIKISKEGTKEEVRKKLEELKEFLAPFEVSVFESLYLSANRKTIGNALIKLKRSEWVNQDLLKKILSLSPEFTIKVDPDTLL